METHSTEKYLEQLLVLMEVKRLYLIKDLSPREIAGLLNISIRRLDNILYRCLGLSLSQIIAMYRIQHAAELLKMGVKYRDLWKFSGFISLTGMDREFEDVVG
ncbi:MAG: hypothetical protein ABFC28_06420 [Rikenellaceae bacterium]